MRNNPTGTTQTKDPSQLLLQLPNQQTHLELLGLKYRKRTFDLATANQDIVTALQPNLQRRTRAAQPVRRNNLAAISQSIETEVSPLPNSPKHMVSGPQLLRGKPTVLNLADQQKSIAITAIRSPLNYRSLALNSSSQKQIEPANKRNGTLSRHQNVLRQSKMAPNHSIKKSAVGAASNEIKVLPDVFKQQVPYQSDYCSTQQIVRKKSIQGGSLQVLTKLATSPSGIMETKKSPIHRIDQDIETLKKRLQKHVVLKSSNPSHYRNQMDTLSPENVQQAQHQHQSQQPNDFQNQQQAVSDAKLKFVTQVSNRSLALLSNGQTSIQSLESAYGSLKAPQVNKHAPRLQFTKQLKPLITGCQEQQQQAVSPLSGQALVPSAGQEQLTLPSIQGNQMAARESGLTSPPVVPAKILKTMEQTQSHMKEVDLQNYMQRMPSDLVKQQNSGTIQREKSFESENSVPVNLTDSSCFPMTPFITADKREQERVLALQQINQTPLHLESTETLLQEREDDPFINLISTAKNLKSSSTEYLSQEKAVTRNKQPSQRGLTKQRSTKGTHQNRTSLGQTQLLKSDRSNGQSALSSSRLHQTFVLGAAIEQIGRASKQNQDAKKCKGFTPRIKLTASIEDFYGSKETNRLSLLKSIEATNHKLNMKRERTIQDLSKNCQITSVQVNVTTPTGGDKESGIFQTVQSESNLEKQVKSLNQTESVETLELKTGMQNFQKQSMALSNSQATLEKNGIVAGQKHAIRMLRSIESKTTFVNKNPHESFAVKNKLTSQNQKRPTNAEDQLEKSASKQGLMTLLQQTQDAKPSVSYHKTALSSSHREALHAAQAQNPKSEESGNQSYLTNIQIAKHQQKLSPKPSKLLLQLDESAPDLTQRQRLTHGQMNLLTVQAKHQYRQSMPKQMLTHELIQALTTGQEPTLSFNSGEEPDEGGTQDSSQVYKPKVERTGFQGQKVKQSAFTQKLQRQHERAIKIQQQYAQEREAVMQMTRSSGNLEDEQDEHSLSIENTKASFKSKSARVLEEQDSAKPTQDQLVQDSEEKSKVVVMRYKKKTLMRQDLLNTNATGSAQNLNEGSVISSDFRNSSMAAIEEAEDQPVLINIPELPSQLEEQSLQVSTLVGNTATNRCEDLTGRNKKSAQQTFTKVALIKPEQVKVDFGRKAKDVLISGGVNTLQRPSESSMECKESAGSLPSRLSQVNLIQVSNQKDEEAARENRISLPSAVGLKITRHSKLGTVEDSLRQQVSLTSRNASSKAKVKKGKKHQHSIYSIFESQVSTKNILKTRDLISPKVNKSLSQQQPKAQQKSKLKSRSPLKKQ